MTQQAPAMWLALLLLAILPADVRAEDGPAPEGYQPPAWPEGPSGGDLRGRLGLMTLITVGVAAAVIWWGRRLPAAGPEGGAGGVTVKVVEAINLGGGCSLHLLQVEDAHYVVGIDRAGLKAIHTLGEPFEQILGRNEDEGDAILPMPGRTEKPELSTR